MKLFTTAIAMATAGAMLAIALLTTACSNERDPHQPGVQQIRWATSSVGSAGHRAKVSLMALLSREWPGYQISVMPTSGAVASIRGYAMNQFDGYYGSDIAFRELATDSGRFSGFAEHVAREPLQSFWAYTMEVGLAVRKDNEATNWRALAGRPMFTGPAAWDVRAQLDRALDVLDVEYRYRELDLGLAGGSLASGGVDAIAAYTAGERALAAWVAEASLSADLRVVNPDADEVSALRNAGLEIVAIDSGVFHGDVGVETAYFVPFYYGFHLGAEIPADDVYRMLRIIEASAAQLAGADAVFAQLADDMPQLQYRGVAASIDSVRVHPGLARYLRAHDLWRSEWDDRVADGDA